MIIKKLGLPSFFCVYKENSVRHSIHIFLSKHSIYCRIVLQFTLHLLIGETMYYHCYFKRECDRYGCDQTFCVKSSSRCHHYTPCCPCCRNAHTDSSLSDRCGLDIAVPFCTNNTSSCNIPTVNPLTFSNCFDEYYARQYALIPRDTCGCPRKTCHCHCECPCRCGCQSYKNN